MEEDRPRRRTSRARGEGSIWQDGKTGGWWCAISINGKQYKYRAADKQSAAARLAVLKKELELGVKPGKSISIAQLAQLWMDEAVVHLKPKTQRAYRQTTEHFLLPLLGTQMPIKEITAGDVSTMLKNLSKAGYSANTVKQVYTVGHRMFEEAIDRSLIAFNPFKKKLQPRVLSAKVVPLSMEELTALRAAVQSHRLYVLYELAWSLGLRKGELLGLRIDSIDFQAATITIKQQVLDLAHGPSLEPYTKNNQIRVLPLSPRLVGLLRLRMELLLAERGDGWQEQGFLFPSERGTMMSQRNLDRHFKGACVAAGVRLRETGKRTKKDAPIYTSTLKFHQLRHTALSWLGETGASDAQIKAIAGHSDKSVTDRYVHISTEALREPLARMERERVLGKSTKSPKSTTDTPAEAQ